MKWVYLIIFTLLISACGQRGNLYLPPPPPPPKPPPVDTTITPAPVEP